MDPAPNFVAVDFGASSGRVFLGRWDGTRFDVGEVLRPSRCTRAAGRLVHAQRPGIGAVFMSGYAKDDLGRGGESGASGEFLAEPFDVETLRRVFGRAADAGRRGTP